MTELVWFITDAASRFGRFWAETALARGDKVVVTARDVGELADFDERYGDAVLSLALDVSNFRQISLSVAQAQSWFGHIDVMVNNAGVVLLGAIGETSEPEVRAEFEAEIRTIGNSEIPPLRVLPDNRHNIDWRRLQDK